MKEIINTSQEWIPISQLPEESQMVKWLCEDGVEDWGFYNAKTQQFCTNDMRSEAPITHWKPLFEPKTNDQ